MKTTKPAVILPALVLLLTAATAQSAEKPAKKEISNTRTAICLVKITSDPAVLPLSDRTIVYLLRSSGVAGKAAREVLDISPDIASELFDIEEVFAVESAISGLSISPATSPGAYKYPTTTPSRTAPARRTPTTPTRTTSRPPSSSRSTSWPTTPRTTTSRPRTPTRRPTKVTQPPPTSAEQTIMFSLHVDFSEYEADTEESIKPVAEEFMVALIENLRSALSGVFHDYRTKFNQQLELAGNEAARAEDELAQMQADLRVISDSRDLSRYVILRNISDLRQQLQSTIMQRASDEMLYEAMAKQIAETETKIKEELANDAISIELQKIIKIQEEKYKAVARHGAPPETAEARENLAKARIELAKRREELSKSAGGDRISSLNDELATLSTNMALAQQEIESLKEQFEQAKDLLRKADPYELLSLKADIAKQNLEEALLWRARLGRNNRSIQPPDVIVIGAE